MAAPEAENGRSSVRYPFWFGGSAAAMATCFTHPLELSESTFWLKSVCTAFANFTW